MKRAILLVCVLAAAAPGTASASRPQRWPSAISGVAEVSVPGCDHGAYKIPFAGARDTGDTWIVARPLAVGVACDAVTYGTPATFIGGWDARIGGCVAGNAGAELCIGPMPDRGVANGVTFRYCPEARRCFVGEAWVVRA